MPEELEVYPRHNWNGAFVFKRAVPSGPPRRAAAWHRDATASATAIARWEDDGGRLAPVGVSGASCARVGGACPVATGTFERLERRR